MDPATFSTVSLRRANSVWKIVERKKDNMAKDGKVVGVRPGATNRTSAERAAEDDAQVVTA
jgi:hypothetical protein